MEISARRNKEGVYQLDMGPVTFSLSAAAVDALQKVIDRRLNQGDDIESQQLEKKLQAYKTLANKMTEVDNRIVQEFAPRVSPEQLVTIVRLAEGNALYDKVVNNLSKQNRRQFEQDYKDLDKITVHNACIYMEQMVPMIKEAARQQKELKNEMIGK